MNSYFLFIATTINYWDRLWSIIGKAMSDELRINAAVIGWVMSSFGIVYGN